MGLFGISEDHIEDCLSLDERFLRNSNSTYFFEHHSDAMAPLILKDDILIVDRSLPATHGRMVVGGLHGDFICRYLLKERGQLVLRAESSFHEDIIVNEDFQLFGVVRGIARDFL